MEPKTVKTLSPNKHLGFKRAKSIRLSDIAREARVSTTTASRVFSTPEKVRPEIILRVQAVAEKLGYLPNSAAQALRSRRTRMVGAIIPTLNHAIYAKEVESLNNRLRHSGYSLVITTS